MKVKKPCNLEAKTSVFYKVGTYSDNQKVQVLYQLYSESQDNSEQIKGLISLKIRKTKPQKFQYIYTRYQVIPGTII